MTENSARTSDDLARDLVGPNWTRARIDDLTGRRALVTGGTRGLGRATALALSRAGAEVLVTGTRLDAATASVDQMNQTLGHLKAPRVHAAALDLTDLAAVRTFARAVDQPLDLLVNNAGIMWGPFSRTAQDVERQLATNFLGHFVLTGELLPQLLAARHPRVVSLSSTYHRFGALTAGDLDVPADRYRPTRAYGTSKLAMLVFARELGRRAEARGLPLTSVAAHPGYANTSLQSAQLGSVRRMAMRLANAALAVPVESGADPVLCAATVPGLPNGTFIGPSRLGGHRGRPGVANSTATSLDPQSGALLWAWATGRSGARWATLG